MPRWDASDTFDGWLYVPNADPNVPGTYTNTHFTRAPGQSGDYNILKAQFTHDGITQPLVVTVLNRGMYRVG